MKNYFINHTDYDFASNYCNNSKIDNNETLESFKILQEMIGKEKSSEFIESVTDILNNN